MEGAELIPAQERMRSHTKEQVERVEHMNTQKGWTLEWVILGWFFQITLLQAGIYARHTKEQETYRFHMF